MTVRIFAGGLAAGIAGVVAASDADAAFVAGKFDFVDAVEMINDPFEQAVSWGSVRISVFVGLCDDQADTLCNRFELLVMIRSAAATVLNLEHGIVVHVTHLMQKCRNGVFNIAVKRPSSYIDFVLKLLTVN